MIAPALNEKCPTMTSRWTVARTVLPSISPPFVDEPAVKNRLAELVVDPVVKPTQPRREALPTRVDGRIVFNVLPHVIGAILARVKPGEAFEKQSNVRLLVVGQVVLGKVDGHRVQELPGGSTEFVLVRRTLGGPESRATMSCPLCGFFEAGQASFVHLITKSNPKEILEQLILL